MAVQMPPAFDSDPVTVPICFRRPPWRIKQRGWFRRCGSSCPAFHNDPHCRRSGGSNQGKMLAYRAIALSTLLGATLSGPVAKRYPYQECVFFASAC